MNLFKHDELISLVHGYLLMNEFNTFYEKTKTGFSDVQSSDLVNKI